MSYWASLEIEMSLLRKRLSAGQFIKESVRAVKKMVELLKKDQQGGLASSRPHRQLLVRDSRFTFKTAA